MPTITPRVFATELPKQSALWATLQDNDFTDSFKCKTPLSPKEAADVGLTMPKWAQALLALRNALVRPFGLKTEVSGKETTGIFPIIAQTEQELRLGTDDKHLNFQISVLKHEGDVYFSTWVRPHNFGGKLYLACIMPFHKLIVRDCVKRVAKHTGSPAKG